MAVLKAIICPVCGSNVPKDEMKCQYCQAEIIIAQQGITQIKNTITCPKCGKELDKENLFCPKCLSVLTTEEEKLNIIRHLQKKIRLEQNDLRSRISSGAMQYIGNDELILFNLRTGDESNTVLTDKRLVIFKKAGFISEGASRQIPLTDMISVSPLHWDVDVHTVTWDMTVNTEKEKIPIKSRNFMQDMGSIFNFQNLIAQAINNTIRSKKNIQAMILSLQLPEKSV